LRWTKPLAVKAIERATEQELALLYRLAAARGRRVPLNELSAAFGLPASPAIEQDFPALSKFCAAPRPSGANRVIPIASGGSGDSAWYWMSVDDANAFRRALNMRSITGE
jgi:hypothetical protein